MNRTLLLVDDDRLVLTVISQALKKAGYLVMTAESADEAEELLAGGDRPDLAILDVNMPGRGGLELAERLRTLDQIPFMLLTAYSEAHIVDHATHLGAMGYLVKPVEIVQMKPAIEAALGRADELRALRESGNQLQNALDNERDTSVAVGITMMQYRLGRKEAFELLRKTARREQRKLAELAADVVRAGEILNLRKN